MGDNNKQMQRTLVPDKVYSFSLQVKHMLYELIWAKKDDIISIEALDDVAIQNNDDAELIQVKSAISSNHNPVSNRAVDFWKTMYNWLQYVKEDFIDSNFTKFRLLVHSNTSKIAGSICKEFNDACNVHMAMEAIEFAKKEIIGDGTKKIPETYRKYVEEFFNTENEEFVVSIVINFKYDLYTEKIYEENLYNDMKRRVLISEYTDKILIYMLGWVQDRTNEMTKEGNPAYISCADFEKELESQVKMYRQNNILNSVSLDINKEDIQKELSGESKYIRQLQIIHMSDENIMSAIEAFLKSSVDKTGWAERGLITNESFEEYDNYLKEHWSNQKELISLSHSNDSSINEEKIGLELYWKCIDDRPNLQGVEPPSYFCKGEYNHLSDDIAIGWHPRYKELLEEKSEQNGQIK